MPDGHRRKPKALKLLHGNPGKRRLPASEPEGVGVLWSPPAWFDDIQREQWHYSVENAPLGLLTGTDREVLVVWCVACVEHARAAQDVRRLGQVVKGRDNTVVKNPYLTVMTRQALVMMAAARELGFSPAARATLGDRVGSLLTGDHRVGDLQAYLDQKPDRLDS